MVPPKLCETVLDVTFHEKSYAARSVSSPPSGHSVTFRTGLSLESYSHTVPAYPTTEPSGPTSAVLA